MIREVTERMRVQQRLVNSWRMKARREKNKKTKNFNLKYHTTNISNANYNASRFLLDSKNEEFHVLYTVHQAWSPLNMRSAISE